MPAVPAENFYTGLVADLYTPLKSTSFAPDPYRELIARYGSPALELGCGDGDPLLDLCAAGLDVDGLDSSPDMITRLHDRAAARGLEVTAWVATMQDMRPPRRYRTVFLAGPTFNLLPDDETMRQALAGIAAALTDGGTAIVPLFVPGPVAPETVGVPTRQDRPDGWIGWSITAVERDEESRVQTLALRYERDQDGRRDSVDRDWTLHWIGIDGFREMADRAGLRVVDAPAEVTHEPRDVTLQRRALDPAVAASAIVP